MHLKGVGFVASVELTDTAGHVGFLANCQLTGGPVGFVADCALSLSPTGFVAEVMLTTGSPPVEPEPEEDIIPQPGTISWVLNMSNDAWSYDDSPRMLTYGDNITDLGAGLSIDDLEGYIDNLIGSIDDLAGREINFPTVLKGLDTGEVLEQSYEWDDDWEGTNFEWEFQSPDLSDATTELTMNRLFTKLEATRPSQVTLEATTDGGINWRIRTTSFVDALAALKSAKMMKQITGRELRWRLRCSIGDVKLQGWWVRLMKRRRHVR